MPGASRAGKDVAVAKMLVAPPSSKMAADWRAKFMLERDIYSQLEARGVPGAPSGDVGRIVPLVDVSVPLLQFVDHFFSLFTPYFVLRIR